MYKFNLLAFAVLCFMLALNCNAEDQKQDAKAVSQKETDVVRSVSAEATQESQHYENVIKDYKAYLASIDPELRKEIIEYRKSLRELNTQKKELYKKLSQQAQNYLKKEAQFRNELPVEARKKFLRQIYKQSESDNSDANSSNTDKPQNPKPAK